MADHTHIEWTDATWNPITGCSVVSPGCTNCCAMKLAGTRLKHIPSRKGLTKDTKAGPVWTGEVRLNEQWLDQPLRWKRPRRIFVCAHGDLFAEGVPDEWIDRVFAVMALAPQHTFQVLTKRADRMRAYLLSRERARTIYEGVCDRVIHETMAVVLMTSGIADPGIMSAWPRVWLGRWPLPNVWLGVSAEDQKRADERIPDLLATPAGVRFVSAEPLLGPIDFSQLGTLEAISTAMPDVIARESRGRPATGPGSICGAQIDAVGSDGSSITFFQTPDHMGGFTASSPRQWPRIDWVIVGGESGSGARPMHPAWVRSIRDQCAAARTAFFFKQWGAFRPLTDAERNTACGATLIGSDPYDRDAYVLPATKKAAGRLLDGIEHNAMPEAPR